MSEVHVATVQFAPGENLNLERIATHVATAAGRGARLIVFPEYSSYFVPEFTPDVSAFAEELDGPFVQTLTALAGEHTVTIVAGMLESGTGERVFNTVVAVDGTGLLAKYRKQHLYDAFGFTESDRIEAGALTAPETFAVDGLQCGLMTCYDLRFPESTRVLVDAGADVIVVPAEWVRGPLKEDHWETLVRARAIENTVYVVAADHPAPIGVGRSMVVDPSGTALASLGSQEGIAYASLSAVEIIRVRAINPALVLRRYGVSPMK